MRGAGVSLISAVLADRGAKALEEPLIFRLGHPRRRLAPVRLKPVDFCWRTTRCHDHPHHSCKAAPFAILILMVSPASSDQE